MKHPSPNLVHLLIGKSILETLLVGTLAVLAFISLVPPYFHGWGEVTQTGISGWAVDNAAPWERVEVQLFIDGVFVASANAMESRPDVAAAGWAKDAWHGYTFRLQPLKEGLHEARVYALHDSGRGKRKSLQLVGDPLWFYASGDGHFAQKSARVDQ
jgi:hypothetical protein